jgi:pimeloyl-ACP methyl ester carboxylesterase
MPRIQANGIAIEYESFGAKNAEPMLLMSGLGMQMTRWSVPFCELLASHGYRVIRFDHRDVGLSTHFDDAPIPDIALVAGAVARGDVPVVPYTLHDMADDAAGLLDALEIERAHMVGRSMGGMVAQLVASEHAHRTLSLASIMSSTGNPALPSAAPEVMALLMQRAPHPSEDEEGFLAHRIALSRALAGPGYPIDEAFQRAQALAEFRRAYNPAGFGRQIAAIAATGDLRRRLNTITAPTLVIHGADDLLIPVAAGADTAANIKHAQWLVIEGMGHELPPALNETVARAVAANAARASRA